MVDTFKTKRMIATIANIVGAVRGILSILSQYLGMNVVHMLGMCALLVLNSGMIQLTDQEIAELLERLGQA